MKRFISIILKPTLSCNIDCKHCYHEPEERVDDRMSFDVLEKTIRCASEEYESVWFIWHGGEPTQMPFSFYKKAIEFQEKYFGKESHRVGNTIQTNGILLDKRFINFCKEHMINIGVAYEGPYNDILRQGSETVDKNLQYLHDKGHMFSVGSTISSETASKQKELYEYFKGREMTASFSPVIPSGCAAKRRELVPDPDEYIRSSNETFDEWLTDKDTNIPLIPHYLYVLNSLGESVEADCAHNSCLTKWMCVYPNGDLYPCAKNCPSQFRLCNISEIEKLSDAFTTEGFRRILTGSVIRREKCASCEVYEHCNGGCSIDACCEAGLENNGGDSCKMFKAIFGHVDLAISDIIKEQKDLSQYNKFVRDAILGKLINPRITNQ